MEDMAYLALIEQSLWDMDKFSKIIHDILWHIRNILENPHDYQLRTIRSMYHKDFRGFKVISDYLKYLGFEMNRECMVYPIEKTLTDLRRAQIAIERKISITCEDIEKYRFIAGPTLSQPIAKTVIQPATVLSTSNPFLLNIQSLFNKILRYEEPSLLALAREHIPITSLQVSAIDRIREQQKKIKTGVIKGSDMTFSVALLMELLLWFKFNFFKWVDSPVCVCGGATTAAGYTSQMLKGEMCKIELYKCNLCNSWVRFPRYNNPRTLLNSRRGRCGEWANCFTLMCRALGYDVRYVYDVTDHVWCEVFDYESQMWLHCDPCEAKLDAPLMYSHGWGKKLSYVIAVTKEDLQDVTWRYVTDFKEVLKRRTECSEQDLIDCIMKLREHRHKQLSEARRIFLAKRNLQELVYLMKERKPEESELHGRISGSAAWRLERGESGSVTKPHTFKLTERGLYNIRYNCAHDRYSVSHDSVEVDSYLTWAAGACHAKGISRKVEYDWKQVYLAREESVSLGKISWQFSASSGLTCKQLYLKMTCALYGSAKITWSVVFDSERAMFVDLVEKEVMFKRTFKSFKLRALLTGTGGDLAWQEAQLFRQPLDSDTPTFIVQVYVE